MTAMCLAVCVVCHAPSKSRTALHNASQRYTAPITVLSTRGISCNKRETIVVSTHPRQQLVLFEWKNKSCSWWQSCIPDGWLLFRIVPSWSDDSLLLPLQTNIDDVSIHKLSISSLMSISLFIIPTQRMTVGSRCTCIMKWYTLLVSFLNIFRAVAPLFLCIGMKKDSLSLMYSSVHISSYMSMPVDQHWSFKPKHSR